MNKSIQKQPTNDIIEDLKEKLLLKKIHLLLPNDLIKIIYEYLNGKAKFICYRKYTFLEINIKQDYYKGYDCWNFIKNIVDSMNDKQFLAFILQGPVKNYPLIIEKLWFSSRLTNTLFDGETLIHLWYKEKTDEKYKKLNLKDSETIDYKIRERIIYSIYNYLLRSINKFEKQKNIQKDSCVNKYNKNNNNVFTLIDDSFKLYKSLEYIHIKSKTILTNVKI